MIARAERLRKSEETFMQIGPGVWVIAGLMVLCVIFLMSMFAKLFRKAGPHEALVVYGFRARGLSKGAARLFFR